MDDWNGFIFGGGGGFILGGGGGCIDGWEG